MSSAPDEQWAWLGLLKWSLSYSDGTKPSSESVAMSEEDKKFLEEVMKNGILDENERMKYIIEQMAIAMEGFKHGSMDINMDELEDLLLELRDIVEKIDYARAFCSLKGLPFLLGSVQQNEKVPTSIRNALLGILATLCQNNPPVQMELLDLGSIRILSEIFFIETEQSVKAKIVQAISANIRNHATAESVYCETEQAKELVAQGLGVGGEVSEQLKKRTLFFLWALTTSDTSDRSRVRKFEACIGFVADNFLKDTNSAEIREMSLQFLNRVLEQKNSVNALLDPRKSDVVALGIDRVSTLRGLDGDEREYASVEVEQWETFLLQLSRMKPDAETTPLITAGQPSPSVLPQ
mmetsp:Transcript_26155/g.39584  ORF Transcript_26155/g.39584 Transcript_26155/m.39584 type:complete len:351 (+) Transcript_26155:98-1150(+)|eukprot:CAMPEP_0178928074 /NCGR_PEP_ID=MMETSP0786-20121207/19638_1 /TAXON_ID=186022 /ORGANISM="Thalassionema frauenfeldii, Strain CCMP 1798" /LENGTH=350 /DNA_ID=CAMNT_0020603771 /DNA_START=76 /DNA_END=1128 /DNA_ORIENTATION=-